MRTQFRFLRYFAVPLALLAFQTSSAFAAALYSNLVVFGDSLSDNGNAAYIFKNFSGIIPPGLPAPEPPLYTPGRYTNGPDITPGTAFQGTWVEQLASKLALPDPQPGLPNFLDPINKAPGTNFAVAGTDTKGGSPVGIDAMVQTYISSQGGMVSSAPLYILFGGANDIFRAPNPQAAATAAVANIFADVQLLQSAGARNFLIPNLPNLGTTPRAALEGDAAALSAASLLYANTWTAAIVNAKSSGENVVGLDLYDLYAAIEANPASYGITNINTPAQGASANPDTYLFWDIQHPTTAGHQLIADAAFDSLNATPEPAALLLTACGFAFIIVFVRRRQVISHQ